MIFFFLIPQFLFRKYYMQDMHIFLTIFIYFDLTYNINFVDVKL